jgi:chemotaxis protein methyltransferase CheR
MTPPLTDDEYRLFAEWLASEFGLTFGPARREILRARLEPRRAVLNLPTFERLLFHVRHHPGGEEERMLLVSSLTNNESYFFRERAQLEVLREEVLPAVAREARAAGRQAVRLLSVGCAAGEEPYTLAMIASERLRREPVETIVTGVDLDVRALERARTGIYRDHAFRGVETRLRDRYFRRDGDGWRIASPIRAAARFEQGNVVDPEWPRAVPSQDAVFCRNVLIYFDEAGVRRAVDNLYRVLRPGGRLFLGHAETLSRIPTPLVAERRAGAIFYTRPEE